MDTRVIKFGKQRVTCGLTWRELPLETSRERELKDVLADVNASYGVVLDTEVNGRATTLAGVLREDLPAEARTAVSGAMWLAETVDNRRTLLVQCIERRSDSDLYWVVGVEPNVVDERLDRIVDEESLDLLIESIMVEDAEENEDPYTIYASGLGDNITNSYLADAIEGDFESISGGQRPTRDSKIRRLRGISGRAYLSAAAALLVLASGYYFYAQIQAQKQRDQLSREAAQLQATQAEQVDFESLRQVRIAKAVLEALKSDSAREFPSSWLTVCEAAVREEGIFQRGWYTEMFTCDAAQQSINVRYLRDQESNATNLSLVAYKGEGVRFSSQKNTASMALPFEPPAQREPLESVEALPWNAEFMRDFPSALQSLEFAARGANYMVGQPKARSILYKDPEKEGPNKSGAQVMSQVPPEAGYMEGTWQVTGADLWVLQLVEVDYPNVVIDQIRLVASINGQFRWQIQGRYFSRG